MSSIPLHLTVKGNSRREAVRNLQANPSSSPSPPTIVDVQGRSLLVPQTFFSRAVMGNETSSPITRSHRDVQQGRQVHGQNERPLSNLSVLMQQQEEGSASNQQSQNLPQPHDRVPPMRTVDEADSGSGPVLFSLGSSNPGGTTTVLPVEIHRHLSTGNLCDGMHRTRRCMSSKELVTLAPPSGSPYAAMLHRKEELEFSTRERMMMLMKARDGTTGSQASSQQEPLDESTSSSSRKRQGTNESRNRRRSEHYHAVVNDLCEVVADLFLAESKLIKPSQYGVLDDETSPSRRSQILNAVQRFVSALPTRYALGADTPSEVLLHMRLMAAARAEKTKAVIHIHSLQDDSDLHRKVSSMSAQQRKSLRLVTISCSDANGLLERITKLLSSGGSRVLDADVMLSSDGIALDRFVVEMTGRLRLDKLATGIESFLKRAFEVQVEAERSTTSSESSPEFSGSIYFKETKSPAVMSSKAIQEDLLTAVPLVDVLESSGHSPRFPLLRKTHSMPPQLNVQQSSAPDFRLEMKHEPNYGILGESELPASEIVVQPDLVIEDPQPQSNRQRRPLVNRSATYDLDGHSAQQETEPVDYLTVPGSLPDEDGTTADSRRVPLIPFEELMLIETIGTGRVSTIYRAVWQRQRSTTEGLSNARMVALKVAMVHNGDNSHVDELRREADIAARLSHPNVCDLKGVAADPDCFCLAYEYCEGGSLHSLLSDPSRYYEYLPIALDIANGMAYLHSRNIIHRDLKASNILLTRDHRAKICDFGMSIMNMGQELTAETGTYRYMAPEVIRHESYSSNADVYSFGICLWQLITREVPFATMTPIQAAYAVAEGRRPSIPSSTPRRLQEVIMACWDQDSYRRPSFTYVAMALADYAKMAFSPANVGTLTLQIANEMLATVDGNSTVNVDFTTPPAASYLMSGLPRSDSANSDVGLQI